MITSLSEAEEYLREIESKPFGYGNESPEMEDFIRMQKALRWLVDELKNFEEKL
jgi:hypothetical protein